VNKEDFVFKWRSITLVSAGKGFRFKRMPPYFLILLTIFSCLLFQSGCGKKTPQQKARETYDQTKSAGESASVYYQERVKKDGEETAALSTVDWLKKQDGITDAGVGSGCIWYKQANGQVSLIQTDSMTK